jgi:hypothetical protein
LRVTDLACAIGMEMDLSRKRIDGIRFQPLFQESSG